MDFSAFDLKPVFDALGTGLATNAIYDYLKAKLKQGQANDKREVERELQNIIEAHGIDVQASTVINVMAKQGAITITDGKLFAPHMITLGSVSGSTVFNGISTTERTKIVAAGQAQIRTVNNAAVRQNPDGSIDFMTGAGGHIDFLT